MSLYHPPRDLGTAALNRRQRQCDLCTQNTLQRRNDGDAESHVVLSPLEFIGRLAALVLAGRTETSCQVNGDAESRFHGVFSPNSKLRGKVVPGKPAQDKPADKPRGYGQTGPPRMGAATQARLRHRSERGPIEKCEKCGGKLKVIASIEDPDVIEKILKHLGLDQASRPRSSLHNRSPPENMFEHTTTLF